MRGALSLLEALVDPCSARRATVHATGAGESADDADKRLSQLQARIARGPALSRSPAPPIILVGQSDEAGTEEPALDANNTAAADQTWLDRAAGNRAAVYRQHFAPAAGLRNTAMAIRARPWRRATHRRQARA